MNHATLLLLGSLFAIGCGFKPSPKPVPVPAGTTIEVFSTAIAAGPNTKPDVDPSTNAAINIVVPPIITARDIATVARANLETSGNPPGSFPALEIVLNPAGTAKMLAATTAPASPNVVVVVNGVIVSVPKILTPINGSFRVTGDHRNPRFLDAIDAATGQP